MEKLICFNHQLLSLNTWHQLGPTETCWEKQPSREVKLTCGCKWSDWNCNPSPVLSAIKHSDMFNAIQLSISMSTVSWRTHLRSPTITSKARPTSLVGIWLLPMSFSLLCSRTSNKPFSTQIIAIQCQTSTLISRTWLLKMPSRKGAEISSKARSRLFPCY